MIKKFRFDMPINEACAKGGMIVYNHIGNIELSGEATIDGSDIEIYFNFIKWGGVDIFQLLDNFEPAEDLYMAIRDVAHKHIESMIFDNEKISLENE